MELHEVGTEQGVLTNQENSLTQVLTNMEFDCINNLSPEVHLGIGDR